MKIKGKIRTLCFIALLTLLIIFQVLGAIVLSYVHIPSMYVLKVGVSLLHGFSPLIGLAVLHVILVFLYFFFTEKVEKIFKEKKDTFSRESARKKWRILWNDPGPLNASYLSLREHSPPTSLLTCY